MNKNIWNHHLVITYTTYTQICYQSFYLYNFSLRKSPFKKQPLFPQEGQKNVTEHAEEVFGGLGSEQDALEIYCHKENGGYPLGWRVPWLFNSPIALKGGTFPGVFGGWFWSGPHPKGFPTIFPYDMSMCCFGFRNSNNNNNNNNNNHNL